MSKSKSPEKSQSNHRNAVEDHGPVPDENAPGHHPEHDQDKPDLDAFAARFSGRALDDLPSETGVITDCSAGADRSVPREGLIKWLPAIAGLAVIAAAVTVGALRLRSRRR